MNDKVEVPEAEVMQEVGGTQVTEGTFVQRSGLKLALGVGLLIAFVTIGAGAFLFINYPQMPGPDAVAASATGPKTAIENYRELSGIAVKNAQDLFHTFVTQALLPVFTAILGYIFAKGDKPESQ